MDITYTITRITETQVFGRELSRQEPGSEEQFTNRRRGEVFLADVQDFGDEEIRVGEVITCHDVSLEEIEAADQA
jgi:hypothetical protein